MWSVLIKTHKIIQKRRPLKIIYLDNTQIFSATTVANGKLKMLLIDCNLCFLIIASIFGLKDVLSGEIGATVEDRKTKTRNMVLGSVLYTLYIFIYGIWLIAAWTLNYRTSNSVFIMNQTMGMYMDRVKNPGKIPGAPNKRASVLFCAVLYNLLMTVIGGFVAVTAIPAISSSNPAKVIFTWILPENKFQNFPYLTKICSCLYIGISSYFSCIPLVPIFCYVTALLYESKYFLKRAHGSYDFTTFYYQWIVYAQYILLDREINRFGSHFNPVIMLAAFGLNVVTTTVCIKFYRDLSLAMLIIFLVFDIVVWSATVVVHSLAVLPKEECEKFHVYGD